MENPNAINVLLAIFVQLLLLPLNNVKLEHIQLRDHPHVSLVMMVSSVNSKSNHQILSISSVQPVSIVSMILAMILDSNKGLVHLGFISR